MLKKKIVLHWSAYIHLYDSKRRDNVDFVPVLCTHVSFISSHFKSHYIISFVSFKSRKRGWLNVNRDQKVPKGEYLKKDLKDRWSEWRNQREKIVEIFPRLKERPRITLNFLRFSHFPLPSHSHSIRIPSLWIASNISAKKHEFLLCGKSSSEWKKISWSSQQII